MLKEGQWGEFWIAAVGLTDQEFMMTERGSMAGTEYLARTWTLKSAICDRSTCTFTALRRMTDEPVIETGMIYYIGTATEVPILTKNDDGSETIVETKYEGRYQ